jgi:dihydrolipoamide dehydrogenase
MAHVVVIGGGPGGYPAAIRAAQLGAQVTLIEKDALGGTCLNRGCIPTKSLLQAAKIYTDVKEAAAFGIKTSGAQVDFKAVMARKNTVVKQLVGGLGGILKSHAIKVVKGTGSFVSPNTVRVSETKEEIKGDKVIVATGSVPLKIPIPGIDEPDVITSDEALFLDKIPKSVVVIGGGVIGLEFAQVFHKMDVDVTVVEMLPQVLPQEDTEIAQNVEALFKKEGIEIFTASTVKSISTKGKSKVVTFTTQKGDQEKVVEKVLVAVGRGPNTKDLGTEKISLKMEKGFITVNEHMETNVPGVFAIGDVIGGYMLAHVATAEGECAAVNAVGKKTAMDYRAVPRAVYTYPEVASVGMNEKEAKEKYKEIRVGRFPFIACGKALVINETNGLVKIITDKKYEEVLGVSIVGPHATDLIAEATLAIQMEATFEELAHTIHAHPTISEAIMEAALDVDGMAIHMPKKRKK